ncbi:hypothetical protein GCM10011366_22580 [Ornithinimicrobium tianjinense]|uniref:CHAT domain-containing protein n=2 Tax=Ornithinimicrobium tianjinense TaxID=1195761 RepID=A0A917BSD7_9MICO|nr:hypothetical protein GCM10011366_22580 [Ornithinimicrobium tianjinense]
MALADAVAASPDRSTADRVAAVAPGMGLTGEERAALELAVVGRQDPGGAWLRHVLATAPSRPERPDRSRPFTDAEMDEAMATASRLADDPGMLEAPDGWEHLSRLEALPAPTAAQLLEGLVTRGGHDGLVAATRVAERVPTGRVGVDELLATAPSMPREDLLGLAVLLGRVPPERYLPALARALADRPDPILAELLQLMVEQRETYATAGAEPPPAAAPAPPPPAAAPAPPSEPVYRSGPRSAGPEAPAATPEATRTAYPRLDLTTGTARPDVVVVDTPFTVTVGLAPRKSAGLVSTGRFDLGEDPIDIVLTYDPGSLRLEGGERHTLTVTADDPYPTVDVTVTALYLEDAPAHRRIGVHYLRGSQVVAVAWRRFVAVDEASLVAAVPAPPADEAELLDLGPVLTEEAPDLVLAVCRADTGSGDRWVWSTYAADPTLPVTDAPDVATLDGEVAEFATATRRAVQFSTNAYSDFLTLAGRAERIGASVPAAVHQAVTALLTRSAADPAATAPTVLLLTEELQIPWELAALDPPPRTPWGGTSPFLGAHVAISRWPLTDRVPRPSPRTTVDVTSAAVVTADYSGIAGWGRLEAALAEADEVGQLFAPPATRVEPALTAVIDLMRGTPQADIVHVALHGQFDNQGEQEGIVLLDRGVDGVARAQFLTPVQLETGTLASGPFVFLNACQVGADERVLGGYGGFASTLLRIGASGVVAPLWNIDDVVASEVARAVYAAALGPPSAGDGDSLVTVAEAVRAQRARYQEDAVRSSTPGVIATLVAFQVFGHPRLRLRRAG